MDRTPLGSLIRFRFGLGRRATVVGGLFVVLVLAVTVVAHILQWQSTLVLRRVAEHDPRQTVAACRILEHAGQCGRLQDRLEMVVGQAEPCREAIQAWKSRFAAMEEQVQVLADEDSTEDESETAAEWQATLARYRTSFLAVADLIEAGRLPTRNAVQDAMKPSRTVLERVVDDAEATVVASQERARAGREELQRMADSRTRLMNVRSVAALLVVVMVVVWFQRVVLSRLKAISLLVSRLAAGDWNARIESRSSDELGLLAAKCNDLGAAMQVWQSELQHARAAAQSTDRTKNEFMANLSQEMRVSLSVISVQADMLLAAPESPQRLEAAETIKHNSEFLLEVVHGVSELVRIESGELRAERAACSPTQVMAEVAAVLRTRAEAKGLRLLVECDGPLPETVETDASRLRQILFILVSNAIKCNEVGEVRLTARYLEHADGGPRLQFQVIHRGIGWTRQQIERLSMPASGDSFAEYGLTAGSLGLAVCRRLVEILDGAMCVDNDLGGQTVMAVTIPAPTYDTPGAVDHDPDERPLSSEESSETPETPPKTPSPRPARFRILLVEDGPENRRLMSLILSKAGAEVILAENGQEAVEAVLNAATDKDRASGKTAAPFDLILMDMQMPVMDGYEATRRLRQSGYSGLIVAVTGHTRSFDRQKCLDVGCNDYLAKPVDREKLLALVAQHVACRSRHVHAGI